MSLKPDLAREPWRAVYDDPRWSMTLREAGIRDGGQCRALLKIPLRELWARGEGARAFDSRIVIMLCQAHHRRAEARASERRQVFAGMRPESTS